MENPGSIAAPPDGKLPILERVLNRVFRCSHRRQTRPITLKGETFAICLDCGRHVPYSLELLQPKKPAPEPPRKSPPAPKQPARKSAAPPKPSDAPKPGFSSRGALRTWTRGGVWLGLLAIGFAGGIYYSGQQDPAPPNRAVVSPPEPPRKPDSVAMPAPKAEPPQPPVVSAAIPESSPPPAPRRPNQQPRLQSDRRFVLLAHEEQAAQELSKDPRKLKELIQTGALFTVSRGTAVRVLEKRQTVVRVAVLEGPVKGEQGWVSAARVEGLGDLP